MDPTCSSESIYNLIPSDWKEPPQPPRYVEKKFDRNEPKKPSVPLRTDHPVMGVQSEKNFIHTNAADVIMGVAKKPKPIFVDKRTGDKHDLEPSGLVPKYINKKDYGITPEYICKRNEEVKKAQEEYDKYIQENLRKAAMKRLSDEEREAVLQGLKKNWEEVHKESQSLSVFIDSIPKKIRKQKLEEEMKQLEHDIGVIEKHKIIYIANK
ncbi:enkurin [Pteropus vampyrus]|uniref:Enkurin n=1 Tax=Pteropus vampyrus TaxID=132908 RepID=A0A6P3R0C2_PTEVA|nr:enkurin [Pteropus vampyrus]